MANLGAGAAENNENQFEYVSVSPWTIICGYICLFMQRISENQSVFKFLHFSRHQYWCYLGTEIANFGAGAPKINENQSKYVSVSPKTNRYG